MKASKKLLTVLCTCFMAFSLAGGIVTTNVATNIAKAEISATEQAKNEAFIKKVKQFSTYSADVLDTYLAPVWNTDEIVDESATIVGSEGFTRLLYAPVRGSVVIRNYHNEHYYIEGHDFEVNYETGDITRLPDGDLPYFELNEYLTNKGQQWTIPYDIESPSRKNDPALYNTGNLPYIYYYADGQRLEHHFNVSYRVNTTLAATAEARWGKNFVNTDVTTLTSAFTPTSQASVYSELINKLYLENEATVMFYGDSITYGCDATGHSSGGNQNPHLPRWSELVCEFLGREYGSNIKYLNGAVGGWNAFDGVEYWDDGLGAKGEAYGAQMAWEGTYPAKYLAENGADSIDLMVFAFGMNDATSNASGFHVGKQSDKDAGITEYKKNIRILINKYLGLTYANDETNCTPDTGAVAKNPNGAIVLMSHMMPNTQSEWYTGTATIPSLHQHTEQALYDVAKEYADKGYSIAVAPVSSVFKTFEEKGKFTRNVLANNINHPTDFAIRVYAQTVLQTLTGYASDSVQMGDTVIGNNKIFIGEGASVRMNSIGMDHNMGHSFEAGIRYRAYVSDDFFIDGVFDSENYEAGMWITPEKFLTNTGIEFNQDANEKLQKHFYGKYYDLNTPGLTEAQIKEYQDKQLVQTIPTKIWDERENGKVYGYHSFNSALIKIKDTMFATDLVARAYIKDLNTGTYYVSRGMQCRNLSQISARALATETNFTPTQTRLLQWFIESSGATVTDTFVYNTKTSASYTDPNAGHSTSTILNITKGDYLQFSSSNSSVMPAVLVVDDANGKLVPINQLYNGLISYNEITGRMTVIGQPEQAVRSFNAYVTTQSATSLYEDYGEQIFTNDYHYNTFENTAYTKKITVAFYNSEFTTPADNNTYKTGTSITFKKPIMKFAQGSKYVYFSTGWAKDANGTDIPAPVGTTLTDNGNGTMTLTATSGNLLGKYTLYANGISDWGGAHTVATKPFTLNVVSEKQYQANVASDANEEKAYDFTGCGTGFKWYCGNDACRLIYNTFSFTEREVQNVKAVDDGETVDHYKCASADCDYNTTVAQGSAAPTSCPECSGTSFQYIAKLFGAGNGLCPLCKMYSLVDCSAWMTDYYWYDATEDAFHYQSVDAHVGDNKVPTALGVGSSTMDIVRFKNNSATQNNYISAFNVTETQSGPYIYDCKYNYFLFDIKFTYANGTILDGLQYDNTLAFWTKPKGLMSNDSDGVKWLSSRSSGSDIVYMFDAEDVTATPVTHSQIVPGNWYTIALDPVAYTMVTRSKWADANGIEDVFAIFCAHAEDTNATGIASDFYFKDFRFANTLGSNLSPSDESKIEFAATNPGTTINYDSTNKYWVYTTANGLNAQQKYAPTVDSNGNPVYQEYTNSTAGTSVYDGGRHSVMLDGAILDAFNDNASKYKYLAIDMMFPSASQTAVPNLMFNVNEKVATDGAGWKPLIETDKVANSQIHRRFLRGDLSVNQSSSALRDTWYTYVIANPSTLSNYLFGVITPSTATIESHTVYFNNIRLLNELNDTYATTYTVSDFFAQTHFTVSDLKVRGNYKQDDPGSNPLVPVSTSDYDATFEPNAPSSFTTTTAGAYQSTETTNGIAWFDNKNATEPSHKFATHPISSCSHMTDSALDDVVTQFKFTNWGYTYSDKIRFDTPIHISQISTLTLRLYAVLGTNITTTTYNPYDVRYGGVRFHPYGATTNTGGYMLPTDVPQGVWTEVTIPDPSVLADSDGWIWGFWVGQSANASSGSTTNTFRNATPDQSAAAYMNLDCIIAQKSNGGQTILCDMHSPTTEVVTGGNETMGPEYGVTHPWPYDAIDCTVEDAPTLTVNGGLSWTPKNISMLANTYTKTSNGMTLGQYHFGTGSENRIFQKIKFKAPISMFAVTRLYLHFYAPYPWASTNGGVRIHAYESTDVTDGVLINFAAGGNVYVTIDNPRALADVDGYIKGFWISQANGIDTSGNSANEHYMNLDYVAMSTQVAASTPEFGYLFSTAKGSGSYQYKDPVLGHTRTVMETHEYRLNDTYMKDLQSKLPANKYITYDVLMTHYQNNIILAQGIPDSSEVYYGLNTYDGLKIDGKEVKQALIYERSTMNSAYKQPITYAEMQHNVWYTVVIPIEMAPGVLKENYVLTFMTYAGDKTEETAGCTAYINNFGFTNVGDFKAIGDDGTDKFDRFVSPNTTYVEYDDYEGIGKAYKLNVDGYIGLTDDVKAQIRPSEYSRMTMEIYFASFEEGNNAIFWNNTSTAIGLREKYDDGKMSVDDTAVVYDVDGNRVDLADIQAGNWYTVEIINPQMDWAILGSTGTEIYFRNMIWHTGEVETTSSGVPDLTQSSPFGTSDFGSVAI